MEALFATETMAELSARQGRRADAVAIYQHLVRATEAAPGADDAGRVARWKARLAELEGGGADVVSDAPATPARAEAPPPPAAVVPAARPTLVVREPVRSGQVIYAEGGDLIVLAPVNSGAQLLADGNIHVYGPLKGRAVAGAHGARDAQVFCLSLEAELVGVDTGYLTSDDVPPDLWGAPARVCLSPDGTCSVVALPTGKRSASPLSRRC